MKINFKTLAILSLGAFSSGAATLGVAVAHETHKSQNVTVTIDESGYHPAALKVKGGQKVHLTFVSKGESCANGVVIPSLKKTLSLKVGQKREVVFTPKKGQTINFACSMNMFKGQVTAK